MPKCRACDARMLWATMPSGAHNPLDVEQVVPQVGMGVVAYNPKTGNAQMVTAANILETAKWADGGVTFHLSHFATCPERERF